MTTTTDNDDDLDGGDYLNEFYKNASIYILDTTRL